jgi:hypothetical protein
MRNWRDKEVKLINRTTSEEVKIGDIVTDFRGETAKVKYMNPPHKSSSNGFVNNYYASVYDCKFVEL